MTCNTRHMYFLHWPTSPSVQSENHHSASESFWRSTEHS